jgi:hypothetical protein
MYFVKHFFKKNERLLPTIRSLIITSERISLSRWRHHIYLVMAFGLMGHQLTMSMEATCGHEDMQRAAVSRLPSVNPGTKV